MSVSSQQSAAARRRDRRLLFAVLAAPAAWTVHEIVGVSIVGRTCALGGSGTLAVWQTVVLGVVSIVAAAIAIASAWTALSIFRGAGGTRITAAEGWNRVEFVALLGFFLSLLLLLGIVYFALTPLLVEPCRSF